MTKLEIEMNTTNDKPEALRLAAALRSESNSEVKTVKYSTARNSASELERQHAEIQRLTAELEAARKDAERIDCLEQIVRSKGLNGISIDYCRLVEDGRVEERGYRIAWRRNLLDRMTCLRDAIDAAKDASHG